VGGSWLIAFIVAIAIYGRGLGLASRIRSALLPLALLLERKYFFDEIYGFVFVKGCHLLAAICRLIDTYVIDVLANLSAAITERLAAFSGRGIDANIVDGVFNGLAGVSMDLSNVVRRPQTGRIRNYVLFASGGAAVVILVLLLLLSPFEN